jgi:ribosomal protein S18 acetylase RimI-like enzyme
MMIIRYTTEEDWETLRDIRLASLLDIPTAFGQLHASAVAYSETAWRDRAAGRSAAKFLLAYLQDATVGIIGHVINQHAEFNVIAMWVKSEYRGMHIAAGLMAAVKAQAMMERHHRIVLDVSPDNTRALAFYRRQGFVFLPEWEALASYPEITVQKMEWKAGK